MLIFVLFRYLYWENISRCFTLVNINDINNEKKRNVLSRVSILAPEWMLSIVVAICSSGFIFGPCGYDKAMKQLSLSAWPLVTSLTGTRSGSGKTLLFCVRKKNLKWTTKLNTQQLPSVARVYAWVDSTICENSHESSVWNVRGLYFLQWPNK